MKTSQEEKTRLEKLGLSAVAKKLDVAEKMKMAYERYLFIPPGTVIKFNEKLRKDTLIEDNKSTTYKRLIFIPLAQYGKLPPENVLNALELAIEDKCFDSFEVAKIDWIKEVKDPILFGVIDGCPDRFFISQWDDDVSIEDLLFMEK